MSLAARICSMVAVEKNPGMAVKIRNPIPEFVALALAEARGFDFRASFGVRHSAFGSLLRKFKFLLLELPVLRLGRLDQQETQILLDPGSQQRALEHGGLNRVERGKKVTAINVILEVFHGLNFSRAE